MTTLNPTLTRRACDRLTTVRAEAPAGAPPSRYTWLRVALALPIPAAADSRRETATLSTGLSTDLARVIDVAAVVAVAAAFVTVLGLVCR